LENRVAKLLILISVAISAITAIATAMPDPSGAETTWQKTERAEADSPGLDYALAGNVTELDLSGYTITRTWQGYFGNVSGTITLEDNSNNTLYNWSVASPEGEVYAANNTVIWTNIQCFNFTATGLTDGAGTCDESQTAGAVSQCGKNLSELEAEFGIRWDDNDGVNETFKNGTACDEACLSDGWGGESHDLFYVGKYEFSPGECLYTKLFDNTGQGADSKFEEVLLWDPNGNNTVFTSLLEEDMIGFDNTPKDFEMLVLENGHGTDTATTTYWFYVELE
jgi:hypothetical protein